MIIYLAPALLVFCLFAAAIRLRHHIEPCCPGCSSRNWQGTSGSMDCMACGWSSTLQPIASPDRQAA